MYYYELKLFGVGVRDSMPFVFTLLVIGGIVFEEWLLSVVSFALFFVLASLVRNYEREKTADYIEKSILKKYGSIENYEKYVDGLVKD